MNEARFTRTYRIKTDLSEAEFIQLVDGYWRANGPADAVQVTELEDAVFIAASACDAGDLTDLVYVHDESWETIPDVPVAGICPTCKEELYYDGNGALVDARWDETTCFPHVDPRPHLLEEDK